MNIPRSRNATITIVERRCRRRCAVANQGSEGELETGNWKTTVAKAGGWYLRAIFTLRMLSVS